MQRAEINDVPVFWQQGPEPLSAVLLFGVGMRDEPFVRRGVTHLVEHLAMGTLGRRHHDHNASVSIGLTSFEAAGRPEAVAAFLDDVCAALRDLPVDRLETERKVLAAEEGGGHGSLLELHLLLRFGLRGPGLAAATPPAADALGADAVRAWAAEHLVRSNAALALTGPPPPGLRLDLPAGPPPERVEVQPLPLGGPIWTAHQDDREVALSVLVPQREAALAAARIARERVADELRHRLGLAYDVDFVVGATAGAGAVLTLFADPAARDAATAVGIVDRVLCDLRDTGPTADELAEDLAGFREQWDDPRAAAGHAHTAAVEHLLGRAWDPTTALREREAVTGADVRAALARYPQTAILTVPEGVRVELAGFRPAPEADGTRLPGRVFKRQPFGPVPRGASLVVGDEGVCLLLRDGAATVRWTDMVGYGEHDDGTGTLYGADGTTIDLHPDVFRGGKAAMELVDARVPAELRFRERCPEPRSTRRRQRA